MSENTLVEVGGVQGKYASEESFAVVATSSQFLPLLQLYGANSERAKEGKIPMGHWGLRRDKDTVEDQGVECNILIVAWRPKALEILKSENMVNAVYNPQHAEFKRISARADGEKDSGCMYGPEYLVYLANAGPSGEWALMFMGSKTARREAPKVKARLGMMATMKIHLIKNKSYSWHGPLCVPCSVVPPQIGTEAFNLSMAKTREQFNNPPETEKELAPDDDTGGESRPQ